MKGVGPAIETADRQIEFSMAVPVCAWCEPRKPGVTRVALTHGICPRHLREVKLELLQMTAGTRARPVRRRRTVARPKAESMLLPL